MTPATPLKQPRGGVVVREMLVNAAHDERRKENA